MKILFAVLVFLAASTCNAAQITLCSAITTTGTKTAIPLDPGAKTFQGSMTVTSGSGTGAITIEGSVDGTWYDSLGTLSVTQTASDSVTLLAPAYIKYRCNVTGVTGTGGTIKVLVGYGP